MDQNLMESLKGKSREERKQIFESVKQSLLDSELHKVNGGVTAEEGENPGSSICPYKGRWFSSFDYICDGKVIC